MTPIARDEPQSLVTDQRNDVHAICVLGMHRSGTSAIAGALHALGAYIGPDAHLMKRRADNPAGFFEHQLLTDLNDAILWALGGHWHEPPALEDGWELDPRLDEFRERARALLHADFGASSLWCWKDPRACLTASFWRPLLPHPRYIVCLRNPMDVARSLHARDGFSLEKGIDLWMRYTSSAVRSTADSPVLFVSYDDVIEHPELETERLAAFIGRSASGTAGQAARAHVADNASLRHHHATVADAFQSPDASYASSAFYSALTSLLALQRRESSLPDDSRSLVRSLADSSERAHRAERETRRLQQVLADQKTALANQSLTIAEQNAVIAKQHSAIAEQNTAIAAQHAVIANQQAALAASATELQRLHALIQHLETPLGALKVGVRRLLPATLFGRFRAWTARVLPRVLRG